MTSGTVIQGDKLVCVKGTEPEEYSLASVLKSVIRGDLILEVKQTDKSMVILFLLHSHGNLSHSPLGLRGSGYHLSSNNYISSTECCFHFSFYGCSPALKG